MPDSSDADYGDSDDVRQRAHEIGIQDPQLFWIARESLKAPLPDGWEEAFNDEGYKYFYNHASAESSWEHPLLNYYRELRDKCIRDGSLTESHDTHGAAFAGSTFQSNGAVPEADNDDYSARFEPPSESNSPSRSTNPYSSPQRPQSARAHASSSAVYSANNAPNSAFATPMTSARTNASAYDESTTILPNNTRLPSSSAKTALAKLNEEAAGGDEGEGGDQESKIAAPVTGSTPGEPKKVFRTKQYYNLWQARYDALYIEHEQLMGRFTELEVDWQSSVGEKQALREDIESMNETTEQTAYALTASNNSALEFLREVGIFSQMTDSNTEDISVVASKTTAIVEQLIEQARIAIANANTAAEHAALTGGSEINEPSSPNPDADAVAERLAALRAQEVELLAILQTKEEEVRVAVEQKDAAIRDAVASKDTELRRLAEEKEIAIKNALEAKQSELSMRLQEKEEEARNVLEAREGELKRIYMDKELEVKRVFEMKEEQIRAALADAERRLEELNSTSAINEESSRLKSRLEEIEVDWKGSTKERDSLRNEIELLSESVKTASTRLASSSKEALEFLNQNGYKDFKLTGDAGTGNSSDLVTTSSDAAAVIQLLIAQAGTSGSAAAAKAKEEKAKRKAARNPAEAWITLKEKIENEIKACFKYDSSGVMIEMNPAPLKTRMESLAEILATYGITLSDQDSEGYVKILLKHLGQAPMVPDDRIRTVDTQTDEMAEMKAAAELKVTKMSLETCLQMLEDKKAECLSVGGQLDDTEDHLKRSKETERALQLEASILYSQNSEYVHELDTLKSNAARLAGLTDADVIALQEELKVASEEFVKLRARCEKGEQSLLEAEEEMKAMDQILSGKLKRQRTKCHELQVKNNDQEQTIKELFSELQGCKGMVARLEVECSELRRELDASGGRQVVLEKLNIALSEETSKNKILLKKIGQLQDELLLSRQDSNQLIEHNAQLEDATASLRSECDHKTEEAYENSKLATELNTRVRRLALNCMSLSNRLCELQGNVRVLCRVRPVSTVEAAIAGARGIYSGSIRRLSSALSSSAAARGGDRPHSKGSGSVDIEYLEYNQIGFNGTMFEFDRVLSPNDSQEDVFIEMEPAVRAVMNGYKACILAYGNTGAGKTHTMIGNRADPGIALRAFESIFNYAKEDPDVRTDTRVSILEVYNERIHDLLDNEHEAFLDADGNIATTSFSPSMIDAYAQNTRRTEDGGSTGAGDVAALYRDSGKSYEIRLGKKTGVYVDGLTEWPVDSADRMRELLDRASGSRRARSAGVDQSSRSHLVIMIKISRWSRSTGQQVNGTLTLVDLAGAERTKIASVNAQRLKESQSVNRALNTLNDVIVAVINNQKHVPFRNSKLTYLLWDCLRDNSRVVLIGNINPLQENVGESMATLHFVTKCRSSQVRGYLSNQTEDYNDDGAGDALSVRSRK